MTLFKTSEKRKKIRREYDIKSITQYSKAHKCYEYKLTHSPEREQSDLLRIRMRRAIQYQKGSQISEVDGELGIIRLTNTYKHFQIESE